MLAANNTPDFRTISDFRKDHLAALSGLFLQVLMLCQREGLVKLGHVALDGTKVRANASKHKAMSYKRMKEKEAQLQGEVEELLRLAQEVDEEETVGAGRTNAVMSCRQSWPFERAGWRGSGRLWRRWKPRPKALLNRLRPRARIILGCPMTRPSATSPMGSLGSCPRPSDGTSGRPIRQRRTRRWWTLSIK